MRIRERAGILHRHHRVFAAVHHEERPRGEIADGGLGTQQAQAVGPFLEGRRWPRC
jgi:hypothetical protein